MIKTVLILLYLWKGADGQPTIKLDQIPVANQLECEAKGKLRIDEQMKDPRFVQGLFGGCIEIPVEEAKN